MTLQKNVKMYAEGADGFSGLCSFKSAQLGFNIN